jgi:hypothetical protein
MTDRTSAMKKDKGKRPHPIDERLTLTVIESDSVSAVDHTASKKQDPIRTPPRSDARPGQYWAGGPPGNTKELTADHLHEHPIARGEDRNGYVCS